VRVRVRDTGIGMRPEILPRVFELFVQEQQGLDRSQGGLGLGLAIVQSLVAAHGGTVEATSDGPDQGSEFTVWLPAAHQGHDATAAAGTVDHAAARRRDGRRLLLVDDNEDAAGVLAEALVELGHDVRVAHHGPGALDLLRGFSPDIAFLDIGLPVMDGYELARRIRALPGLGEVRLVAVTGYGHDGDREAALRAGFHLHLVKPVRIPQLEEIVRGLELAQAPSPPALPDPG
jgi:CheY-like chemotaxis protein